MSSFENSSFSFGGFSTFGGEARNHSSGVVEEKISPEKGGCQEWRWQVGVGADSSEFMLCIELVSIKPAISVPVLPVDEVSDRKEVDTSGLNEKFEYLTRLF